jgi:hypothetical protein
VIQLLVAPELSQDLCRKSRLTSLLRVSPKKQPPAASVSGPPLLLLLLRQNAFAFGRIRAGTAQPDAAPAPLRLSDNALPHMSQKQVRAA